MGVDGCGWGMGTGWMDVVDVAAWSVSLSFVASRELLTLWWVQFCGWCRC
jgi:hypothetical protein